MARRSVISVAKRLRGPARGFAAFWVVKLVALAIFASSGFIGCGPLGPIPGGALSGPVGSAQVEDWSFASEVERAQLETRPEDPHLVNTWFAYVDTALYVPTSMILGPKAPSERSWVTHVAVDDRVRIRLGETVFERRAHRLAGDGEEYRVARAALEARYEITAEDRDPERVIWIYRLDPRAE